MKCPHCGQEHPDELIECPVTGKKLKLACKNPHCSYYGEYIFPFDLDTCPCCGLSLIINNNGHEFVDLGLSVKWATCNVGAEKPEEYGDYFAWGETKPKSSYDWSTLKYCNDSTGNSFSKYNQNQAGTRDNRTVLEPEDDAAHANWGGDWRMPTEAEFQELIDKCTWEWTKINGKNGYKVTSKVNSNSIFLPAAGCRYDTSLYYAGIDGDYWSSSLYESNSYNARSLDFNPGYHRAGYRLRFGGHSVRPVFR